MKQSTSNCHTEKTTHTNVVVCILKGGQVKHRPKIWNLSRSKLSVWDGSEQPIILTMELQVGVACILLLITIIYSIKIKNNLYY